jgi:hypothetical protein
LLFAIGKLEATETTVGKLQVTYMTPLEKGLREPIRKYPHIHFFDFFARFKINNF